MRAVWAMPERSMREGALAMLAVLAIPERSIFCCCLAMRAVLAMPERSIFCGWPEMPLPIAFAALSCDSSLRRMSSLFIKTLNVLMLSGNLNG
jgi:hypothetical protein